MDALVYGLCAATSLLCAFLLVRGYTHKRSSFLLWSACGFIGLATNNVLNIVDKFVFPETDFSVIPVMPAVIGLAIMLYGLVRDTTV